MKSKLLLVLFLIFARLAWANQTPNEVLAAGAGFQALSARQIAIAQATLLAQIVYGALPTPTAVLATGASFQALSDRDLQIAIATMMNQMNAGISNGTFYGNGAGLTNLPGLLGQTNKTIYVDPVTGSDTTGRGTQEKPFKTIGYQFTCIPDDNSLFVKGGAMSIAQSGDAIYLMPGNHTNEVVQLWSTNGPGIHLLGSGRNVCNLYAKGTLTGGSGGQNIIQLGNGSRVIGLSVYGTTNVAGGGNPWYNPIGNATGTQFEGLYWVDAVNGGNAPADYRIFNCTNCVVSDCYLFGFYDSVYLNGNSDYSIKFYDCEFAGNWDLFAVQGYNTNTAAITRCWNCTFSVRGDRVTGQNGDVVHGVDSHGGYHWFYDCDWTVKNGGTNVGAIGGTYGVYAEDGLFGIGQTNQDYFIGCTFDVTSTNAGVVVVTNRSSVAGKSIVRFYGGQADYTKMTNWLGYVNNTTADVTMQGALNLPTMNFPTTGGINAAPNFQVTADGSFFSGTNKVIISGGSININQSQVIDFNDPDLAAEFSSDGSFVGPVSWTAAGAMTATSYSGPTIGVTGASSAAAGNVGQVISAIAAPAGGGLSTGTASNILSISLTAGDWDVQGAVTFVGTTATASILEGGISTTSATVPTDGSEIFSGVTALGSGKDTVTLPRKVINVSSTTVVYLVGKTTFSVGSVSAYGNITARRVR